MGSEDITREIQGIIGEWMRRGGEMRRMRSREVQRAEIGTVRGRMMETVSAEIKRDKEEERAKSGRGNGEERER